MKNKLFFLLCLIVPALFACGSSDSDPDPAPDPDPGTKEVVDIVVPAGKVFVHPGMLHTQEDLSRITAKVKAGAEPWLAGYNKLAVNSHALSTYSMKGPVKKLIRGGGSTEEPEADNYSTAMNDAAAAYQNALMWHITGETAHADKSIQILNAWASTCERISGDTNTALGAGLYGYQFANAAELMRDYEGWSTADLDEFKQWMIDVFYSVSYNFLETHWGTCKSHYWANWDLCNIANVMSIGILCDRVDMYKYAIDYLMGGVGNGNLKNFIIDIHAKSYNDDIDLAQIQESGRDQGHSLMCIGMVGLIAQIAWTQGEDLYGYNDNVLLKAAEYVAKYNFGNLNVPFTTYTRNYKDAWSICGGVETHTAVSESGRGGKRPIWEIMYNHYVVRKGITARYVTIAANVHRPEGGGGHYGTTSGGFDNLGFGTLLHSLE